MSAADTALGGENAVDGDNAVEEDDALAEALHHLARRLLADLSTRDNHH